MIPSITAVRMSGAATRAELPLLVLGPDLGTTASAQWTDVATHLADAFDVLAWDLPGHGYNRGLPEEGFTLTELAAGVLRVVDDVLVERGELGGPFSYAGPGAASAAVGRQLLLDQPTRVRMLVTFDSASWADPARPGSVVPAGSDLVVAALAEYDDAGRADELAAYAAAGRFVVASADEPVLVARALREHLLGEAPPVAADGLLVAFDRLVAPAAAGDAPALDPRARHLVTLATLTTDGDLAMLDAAVRAAVTDGVTPDEVLACLLQVAAHVDPHRVREAAKTAQTTLTRRF